MRFSSAPAAAPAAERPTLSLTDKEKRLSALRNPADIGQSAARPALGGAAHLAVERVDQGDDPSAPGAAREMRRSQTAEASLAAREAERDAYAAPAAAAPAGATHPAFASSELLARSTKSLAPAPAPAPAPAAAGVAHAHAAAVHSQRRAEKAAAAAAARPAAFAEADEEVAATFGDGRRPSLNLAAVPAAEVEDGKPVARPPTPIEEVMARIRGGGSEGAHPAIASSAAAPAAAWVSPRSRRLAAAAAASSAPAPAAAAVAASMAPSTAKPFVSPRTRRLEAAAAMEAAAEAAMPDTAWEAVEAADGRVYFWNTETDEVTWSPPPALAHLYRPDQPPPPPRARAARAHPMARRVRRRRGRGGARVAARDCTAAAAARGDAIRKETMAARARRPQALLDDGGALRRRHGSETAADESPAGPRESFKGTLRRHAT